MKRPLLSRLFFLLFVVAQTPLAASAGMNLRVDNVGISPASVAAGGTTQFTATVTNTGDQVTAAIVQVYLSPDAVLTKFDDQWLTFAQSPVLYPGQSATVTQAVTLPAALASGNYFLGTITWGWYDDVDPSDNVGVTGIAVQGASCSPDAFEHDDTLAAARPVALNTIQQRNYCDDPDDWVSFQAVGGVRYGIQSAGVGYEARSLTLAVFAADGTQLAATAVGSGSANPRLVWTAPASGTYYVRSRPTGQWYDVGVGTEYTFVVADVLADLVMPYSEWSALQGVSGGTGWLYTAVANYGFTDSGPFDVGVYLSPDPVVTREDTRVGYRSVAGLAPDRSADIGYVLIAYPAGLPAGTYYLAALADDTDRVAEYEEGNNHSAASPVTITGPSCSPDMYESDDMQHMARPIAINEQQERNFCEDIYDWVHFDAVAGRTYYPRAMYPAPYPGGQASAAGSVEVYDANGQLLAKGSGVVAWTAPQSGRYYVLARGGLNANSYSLAVLDQLPDLAAVLQWAVGTLAVARGGVIDDGTYAVRNYGFVDAPPSLVGFYFSDDRHITPADRLLRTVPVAMLAPNALETKTYVRVPVPSTQAAGTYQFGAVADAGNTVVEFDEANNGTAITEILVVEPPCAPDAYDDDDLPGQARPLAPNEAQSRNFCEDGYDWASLDLQAGVTYAFETRGAISTRARPVVYDADGQTVLVKGDIGYKDAEYGWAAVTAPGTGRYYLLVTSLDQYDQRTSWGTYKDYTLRMSTCQPDAFEQDDSDRTAGRPIAVGGSQARNHCEDSTDWAALTLSAPGSYTVATGNLGPNADTMIEIHSATSTTALAFNDNQSVNNEASAVTYNFASAGTYYVRVFGKQRGAGTEYTLSVQPAKGRK